MEIKINIEEYYELGGDLKIPMDKVSVIHTKHSHKKPKAIKYVGLSSRDGKTKLFNVEFEDGTDMDFANSFVFVKADLVLKKCNKV